MAKVAILPVTTAKGHVSYCAVSGDKYSQGRTAGEALDALTAQLSEDEAGLIIVQNLHPDRFFNVNQQQQLARLMDRWRAARDQGLSLPADDQAELEALIEAELHAATDRVTVLLAD